MPQLRLTLRLIKNLSYYYYIIYLTLILMFNNFPLSEEMLAIYKPRVKLPTLRLPLGAMPDATMRPLRSHTFIAQSERLVTLIVPLL